MMTVKDLRAVLEGLPDDAEVTTPGYVRGAGLHEAVHAPAPTDETRDKVWLYFMEQ